MNFVGLDEYFKWINDNRLLEAAKTGEEGKMYYDFGTDNFFISASRSFTSIVKNIKLLVENPDVPAAIDRFLRKFSTVYEKHRKQFKDNVEFINDEDYLVYKDGRRVALTNASSGEQALFPVLVYLKKLHQKGKSKLKTYLFFEEPELHIFPKFQFKLLQLLMFIFNENNVRLFITTHSPYVLSMLNTFIQAAELEDIHKGKPKKLEQLYKIIPQNEIIKPKDLNAYEIENGKANLLARENGLIGENIIDKVSDEDSIIFGELLDLLPADA